MTGMMFYRRKSDGVLIPVSPGPQGPPGPPVATGGITQTDADNRYVNMDGDEMVGPLNVLNPTADKEAANKLYVDQSMASKLDLTGGTLTGVLLLQTARLNGPSSTDYAEIQFQNVGTMRTILRQNLDSAGGDFDLITRNDDGSLNKTVRLVRQTGVLRYVSNQEPTNDNELPPRSYVDDKFRAKGTNATIDWNDATTPGVFDVLMHGVNNPNGPGYGVYYYVMTVWYATSNLTQIAIPYMANTTFAPVMRSRYNGTWTTWYYLGNSPLVKLSLTSGFADPYANFGYYKNGGRCFLSGQVTNAGTVSAGTTIASGFPPPADGRNKFFLPSNGGGYTTLRRIYMSASGTLIDQFGGTATDWGLDGFSYPINN